MGKQKLPSYNIEFSHIYADEKFSSSHAASIDFLKDLIGSWEFPHSTIVLIDDYNVKSVQLDPQTLLAEIKRSGIRVDFWAHESALVAHADNLLRNIQKAKLQRQYTKYIKEKGKYPCSFLTVIWYLVRLGVLANDDIIKPANGDRYKPADRLINILSAEYQDVERKTWMLLENSKYKDALYYIQNFYYDAGRESPPSVDLD